MKTQIHRQSPVRNCTSSQVLLVVWILLCVSQGVLSATETVINDTKCTPGACRECSQSKGCKRCVNDLILMTGDIGECTIPQQTIENCVSYFKDTEEFTGCQTCKNGFMPTLSAEQVSPPKNHYTCSQATSIQNCYLTFLSFSLNINGAIGCWYCDPDYAKNDLETTCTQVQDQDKVLNCKYYRINSSDQIFCRGCKENYTRSPEDTCPFEADFQGCGQIDDPGNVKKCVSCDFNHDYYATGYSINTGSICTKFPPTSVTSAFPKIRKHINSSLVTSSVFGTLVVGLLQFLL